jgi:hypothetical protein
MAGELDALMLEFASRHGIETAAKDADGRYYLTLDESLQIGVLQNAERVYLEGRIGDLPQDRNVAEELLARALNIHLARLRNNNAVLSIDPQDSGLLLFDQIPLGGLALRRLEAAIGSFANGLAFWRRFIAQDTAPRQTAPPPLSILFP